MEQLAVLKAELRQTKGRIRALEQERDEALDDLNTSGRLEHYLERFSRGVRLARTSLAKIATIENHPAFRRYHESMLNSAEHDLSSLLDALQLIPDEPSGALGNFCREKGVLYHETI